MENLLNLGKTNTTPLSPATAPVPGYSEFQSAELVQKERLEAEKAASGELYDRSVERNHVAFSLLDRDRFSSYKAEPEFDKNVDQMRDDLESAGVPLIYFEELSEARSEAEYLDRLRTYANQTNSDRMLGLNGWRGVGYSILGSASDPAGMAIDSAMMLAAGAGLANRGRKLKRIADMANKPVKPISRSTRLGVMATATGLSSAAIGAAQRLDDPTRDLGDVVADFAMGAAFGAVFEGGSILLNRKEAKQYANQLAAWEESRRTPTAPAEPPAVTARRVELAGELQALRDSLVPQGVTPEGSPQVSPAPAAVSPANPAPAAAVSPAPPRTEVTATPDMKSAEGRLKAATDHVRSTGDTSKDSMAKALGVSKKQADTLIRQLERSGVVSTPDASGKRKVFLSATPTPAAVSPAPAAATPVPEVTMTTPVPAAAVDTGGNVSGLTASSWAKDPKNPTDIELENLKFPQRFTSVSEWQKVKAAQAAEAVSKAAGRDLVFDGKNWTPKQTPGPTAAATPDLDSSVVESPEATDTPDTDEVVELDDFDFSASSVPEDQPGPPEFSGNTWADIRELEDYISTFPPNDPVNGLREKLEKIKKSLIDLGPEGGNDSLSAARVYGAVKGKVVELDIPESQAGKEAQAIVAQIMANNQTATWGGWYRRLWAGTSAIGRMLTSDNPKVAALGRLLARDDVKAIHTNSTGFRGEAVVNQAGVEDWALMFRRRMFVDFRRSAEEGLKGALSMGRRVFDMNSRLTVLRRAGRAAKGLEVPDANTNKILAAAQKAMNDSYDLMDKYGVVGLLPKVAGYFPRVRRGGLMGYLAQRLQHGEADIRDKLIDLIDESMQNARAAKYVVYDKTVNRQVATAYVDRLLANPDAPSENPASMSDFQLENLDDFINTMVRGGSSIDPQDADALMKYFAHEDPKGPAVPSDRQKPRLLLDETHFMTLSDGTKFYVAELFEDNVESVVERYVSEAAGAAAFAKMGIKNWRSVRDMLDGMYRNDEITRFEYAGADQIMRGIFGKGPDVSIKPNHPIARAIRTMTGYNFVVYMGSTFISMLTEVGKVMGLMSGRAVLKTMPAVVKVLKEVATGQPQDTLSRQLSAMVEPGATLISNPVSMRMDEFGHYGEYSSSWERGLDRGMAALQRLTAIVGGSGSMQDGLQKQFSRVVAQELYEWANGSAISAGWKDRLLDYGLIDSDVQELLTHIKTHAKADKYGVLTDIALSQMSERMQDNMSLMMNNIVRHIIMEQNPSQRLPFMSEPILAMFMQFMSYPMIAFQRHTLHNLSRMDREAAMMMMFGTAAGMTAVLARAHLHHPEDSEIRRKLYENPENLIKAGWAATSEASIIPSIVDTLFTGLTNNDAIFNNYHRSSALGTNLINSSPVVNMWNNVGMAAGIPWAIMDPNQQVSKEQANAGFNLFPLKTAAGIQRTIREVTKDMPSSRELESGNRAGSL